MPLKENSSKDLKQTTTLTQNLDVPVSASPSTVVPELNSKSKPAEYAKGLPRPSRLEEDNNSSGSDDQPPLGDMFDSSDSESDQADNTKGKDTQPKRSCFLIAQIDKEEKEKVAEARKKDDERGQLQAIIVDKKLSEETKNIEEALRTRTEQEKKKAKELLEEEKVKGEAEEEKAKPPNVNRKSKEVCFGDTFMDDDEDDDESGSEEDSETPPRNNDIHKKSSFGGMITQNMVVKAVPSIPAPQVSQPAPDKIVKTNGGLQEAPKFIAGLMGDSDNEKNGEDNSNASKSKQNSPKESINGKAQREFREGQLRAREMSMPGFSTITKELVTTNRKGDSEKVIDKKTDSLPESAGSTVKILDLVQFGRKNIADNKSQPAKPENSADDFASKGSIEVKPQSTAVAGAATTTSSAAGNQIEKMKKFKTLSRQTQFQTQILGDKDDKAKKEKEIIPPPTVPAKDNEFTMMKIARDFFGDIAK